MFFWCSNAHLTSIDEITDLSIAQQIEIFNTYSIILILCRYMFIKRGGRAVSIKAERTERTASYKVFSESEGNRYAFFCDLSGMLVYKTEPIRAQTPQEELRLAWKKARSEFNYCLKCGRNVCNTMFNVDVSECVDCSPWLKPPVFCSRCGARLNKASDVCGKCGSPIKTEGVDEDA